MHRNSIITGINSLLFRLCQNYSCQPILVAGAVVAEDSLHQGIARAPPSHLQADGEVGVDPLLPQQQNVLLSQLGSEEELLVDPPRQVEVLLLPGLATLWL